MGKPLTKVARKKARDVAKADWPYFHSKIIVIYMYQLRFFFQWQKYQ